MSMFLAALLFVPLLAVALANFLWALGWTWPITDPDLLARTVIGRPGVRRIPRFRALLAAILALVLGIVALALADHDSGGAGLTILGALVGVAFLVRGGFGYTQRWRARYSEEPFATLDRKNYSPLALLLGAGFLLLCIMRLI